MYQPDPTRTNPESESPPTGGLSYFPEPLYLLTRLERDQVTGQDVESEFEGPYCGYTLRSWEAAGALEWCDFTNWLVTGPEAWQPFSKSGTVRDPETGLPVLHVTTKAGEEFFLYARPVDPALAPPPRGLYTLSGNIENWTDGTCREIERMDEFLSNRSAAKVPLTLDLAADELDRLAEYFTAEGRACWRYYVQRRDGVFHAVAPEEATGEIVAARYSDFSNIVFGYAAVTPAAMPSPSKERG